MVVAQEQELITIPEAAKRYGVTRTAVYEWIKRGRIQRYERQLPYRVFVDAKEIDRLREIHPVDGEGDR